MSLRPSNAELLALEPFVVATPETQAALDLAPFGLPIEAARRIDPLHTASAPFLDRLARLDAATFGAQGMPMPRWLFYDGAELTGIIFGLAREARQLEPAVREALGIERDDGAPVPLAMYVAIPTWEPAAWVGHNLASLSGRFGAELRGLGAFTKALALRVARASRQMGASQWSNPAVFVHTRMGPLDLLTAWTPAHSHPATFTYSVPVTDDGLRHLARDPSATVPRITPTEWIASDDEEAMKRLQDRIEDGERLQITGRPQPAEAGRWHVPIAHARGS